MCINIRYLVFTFWLTSLCITGSSFIHLIWTYFSKFVLFFMTESNFIVYMYHMFGASQVALVVKNPPASAGDMRDVGSITGSGRFPGEGNGNPLQYSFLPWRATVCGVSKCLTWPKWLRMQWTLSYMCLLELWLSQGICAVVGLLGHMVDLFLVF